jgi:GDP-mannose transporter
MSTPQDSSVEEGIGAATEAGPHNNITGNMKLELESGLPGVGLPTADKPAGSTDVYFGVFLYGACSSTLLIINKLSLWVVPDASFVLLCQFVFSSLTVRVMKILWPDMDIEFLTWEKSKGFIVATLVFYACLLANTKALQSVNVETVIVARSCSPIAVSLLDHFALKRPLPSLKGFVALTSIALGAVIYVVVDEGFQVSGYAWLMLYFIFIVVEMVFVKFIVETIPMSTWTRVYYNNTLSLPMAMITLVTVDEMRFLNADWTPSACMVVLLSCVVGVGISYAGFNLRKLVSATSFTVVGVVCKLVTVLINDVIWKQHSNFLGHVGLFICIAAGFWYERVKSEKK